MIALRRILVAVDFTDHSRQAMAHAAGLAEVFGSEVILCHVVESPSLLEKLPPMGEEYFPPNLGTLHEEQARKQCEALAKEFGLNSARIEIPMGRPFVKLVQLAREEDVDLIVLGTHGHGSLGPARVCSSVSRRGRREAVVAEFLDLRMDFSVAVWKPRVTSTACVRPEIRAQAAVRDQDFRTGTQTETAGHDRDRS